MPINMGLDFGIGNNSTIFYRKHRWLFEVPNISVEPIYALPPFKSARPSLSFKEIAVEHMNETVYYPGKPEWKAVPLTLYDLKRDTDNGSHPVWEWIKKCYDPGNQSRFRPSAEGFKVPQATLRMYDGAGEVCQSWIFETVWCQNIEFGELDMSVSDIVTCNLTLRYDRAYLV